ncbi:uncharacterized protein [Musca autumnalis]|uniref:uncharacterized protein n=1 Tax=Musca autumnalis TaxID=221902 RepID=UPI003CF11048
MEDKRKNLNEEMKSAVKNFLCDMMLIERNSRRENLLHYACHNNLYYLIIPFVRQGYCIYQQDIEGQTPLHIAIIKGHQLCVEEFLRLFEICKRHRLHETALDPLRRDIHHMFLVYNYRGYTVLHEAVRREIPLAIFGEMLKICLALKLNFEDMEILGSGDTLLHLIVQYNRLDLARIICDLVPELLRQPNYPGILPLQMECITREMANILRNENSIRSCYKE